MDYHLIYDFPKKELILPSKYRNIKKNKVYKFYYKNNIDFVHSYAKVSQKSSRLDLLKLNLFAHMKYVLYRDVAENATYLPLIDGLSYQLNYLIQYKKYVSYMMHSIQNDFTHRIEDIIKTRKLFSKKSRKRRKKSNLFNGLLKINNHQKFMYKRYLLIKIRNVIKRLMFNHQYHLTKYGSSRHLVYSRDYQTFFQNKGETSGSSLLRKEEVSQTSRSREGSYIRDTDIQIYKDIAMVIYYSYDHYLMKKTYNFIVHLLKIRFK